MTQEGAKKWAKEIQAFIDGKTIQYFKRIIDVWADCNTPEFECGVLYRIKPETKPEPKLVPFDFTDAKMLIGKVVKHIELPIVYMITGFYDVYVYLNGQEYTFEEAFELFIFLDGSPFGKEVQE